MKGRINLHRSPNLPVLSYFIVYLILYHMQKILPIDCDSCGNSYYGGIELKSKRKVEIQIGRCLDGDDKYDCYIFYIDNGQLADTCIGEFSEVEMSVLSAFEIEVIKAEPVCFQ